MGSKTPNDKMPNFEKDAELQKVNYKMSNYEMSKQRQPLVGGRLVLATALKPSLILKCSIVGHCTLLEPRFVSFFIFHSAFFSAYCNSAFRSDPNNSI